MNLVSANELKQTTKINLFKIRTLNNELVFLCDTLEIKFLGDTYEVVDCSISGVGVAEGNEQMRPTLKIGNPNSFLHKVALGDNLEGSVITHYQLQQNNVLATYTWQIYQIMSVTTELVVQLRTLTDIPAARIPHRGYYPPEFSYASI